MIRFKIISYVSYKKDYPYETWIYKLTNNIDLAYKFYNSILKKLK